jgi:hypothetical protein
LLNPYNGRLAVYVGEIEDTTGKKFDLVNTENQEELAKYLWQVDESENKETEKSLRQGQLVPGVITADGVVVDGNRRASILMRLRKKEGLVREFYTAVIEDEFNSNRQRLELLETGIQIGTPGQKDYGAIEKYIKAKKMYDGGSSIQLIAYTWNRKEKEIQELLEIAELMNEYLVYTGVPGYYSRLEKTEDMFIQLNKLLGSLNRNTGFNLAWEKSALKIKKIKLMHFNLIRYTYNNSNSHKKLEPKKHGRILMSTGKKSSLMQNPELIDKYIDLLPGIEEESNLIKSIDDYKLNSNLTSISEAAAERDREWAIKVSKALHPTIERLVNEIELNSETRRPVQMLEEINEKLLILQELVSKDNFSESETYDVYYDDLVAGVEDAIGTLGNIKIELNDPN